VLRINPDKIGAVIGPGGKVIKKITEETGCDIAIEDSGEVKIYSRDVEAMKRAVEQIEAIAGDIEVGKTYRGRVRTLKDFGVFVEVLPGRDGMVHISELASFRVNRVEDICKEGDEMWVKCIGVDEKGRVRLSRKAALEEKDREAAARGEHVEPEQPPPGYEYQPSERRDHGERRDDRGGHRDRDRGRGPRRDRSHARRD
jgi:polyribonucleotide nucleotidyltransferase